MPDSKETSHHHERTILAKSLQILEAAYFSFGNASPTYTTNNKKGFQLYRTQSRKGLCSRSNVWNIELERIEF